MTSKDFIDNLAAKTGMTKKSTKEFVDAFEITLKESVGSKPIKVADLTFSVVEVGERIGRNPKTEESILIPAHRKLKVKPSSNFKEMVKA